MLFFVFVACCVFLLHFLYIGGYDPIFICLTSCLLCVLAHLLSVLLVVLLSLFPISPLDPSHLRFVPLSHVPYIKIYFGQRQFDISAAV